MEINNSRKRPDALKKYLKNATLSYRKYSTVGREQGTLNL